MTALRLCAVLCLVGLGLGAHAAHAQDSETEDNLFLRGTNSAISFTLDALSLDGLDGGIGARWWLGPNTALRPSLGFAVTSDEDITDGLTDGGRSAVTGSLGLMVEWHSFSVGHVSPYLGSGFNVGASAFSETFDFNAPSELAQRRRKGTSLNFGVQAALGVEVMLSRRVSLSGEHLIGAVVDISEQKQTEDFRDGRVLIANRDIRNFTLGTSTSRLILSVYY